jgi:hypothetical protein
MTSRHITDNMSFLLGPMIFRRYSSSVRFWADIFTPSVVRAMSVISQCTYDKDKFPVSLKFIFEDFTI